MAAAKVAITIDRQILQILDRWVGQGRFASRSQAIQMALKEKLERWKRVRLAEELQKLDVSEERKLSEERFTSETWPEY